jgi:molybdopterin molybdotransferase
VTVREGAPAGTFIRPAGLDFVAGAVGLTAGRRLTARDIGLAAAMNHPWLRVRRRPRVAILATGDEIVRPGDPIGPNQIVSSNALALSALIKSVGGDPIMLGIAPDESVALRRMAAGAQGADLLVTTGGASVGDHDLVRSGLASDGLALDFWSIAMRPGKPLMFGRLGAVPLLGLPGNPVSSLVCGMVFLKPALEALLGLARVQEPRQTARLATDLKANDQRQDYLRARLQVDADDVRQVLPFPRQDSSMLSPLAQADCLVVRPPHAPAARAGTPVEIIPLGGAGLPI